MIIAVMQGKQAEKTHKSRLTRAFALFAALFLAAPYPGGFSAHAATYEERQAQMEERKNDPVETNQYAHWPAGPAIGTDGAVLLEANTGTVLYAKNPHKRLYPASTTKVMTALLAYENLLLTDEVTFSHEAVFSIERGSSNIGMDEGEMITVEEALYGLMVGSANEVANALAETVSGSIDAFSDLMNARASELGCTNTHFTNPHGLFHEEHYTSAYDLALISAEYFKSNLLIQVGSTPTYHFLPTATQPDDFTLHNKHKLINGEMPYEGIMGGKTGYTSEARETLVTCCERDGMKLVCVILKEESPYQFTDTVELFDYGFSNFKAVNVAENAADYAESDNSFFDLGTDIFGVSGSVASIDPEAYVVLPKSASLADCTTQITYGDTIDEAGALAEIGYYFGDLYVGSAALTVTIPESASAGEAEGADAMDFDLNGSEVFAADTNASSSTVYVNIKRIIFFVIFIAAILIAGSYIYALLSGMNLSLNRKDRRRYRRRKKEATRPSRFDDYL